MTKDPKAGTTDQRPKWVGSSESRPRGYVPGDENAAEDTKTSEDERFSTHAVRNQRSTYRLQIDTDLLRQTVTAQIIWPIQVPVNSDAQPIRIGNKQELDNARKIQSTAAGCRGGSFRKTRR